ncbi:hypothetical protein DK853_21195 [Klebsiella oxytoca]|nr:hypothetical protein DK853_21195 [Klebsiella oxytoca]
MGHHLAALGESDFTHGDLLRGHNLYVGGSLKINGLFCRVTYRSTIENGYLMVNGGICRVRSPLDYSKCR